MNNDAPRETYADIMDLPHHRSKTHRPMSLSDRAAQFSPFAALSGYDAMIREAARLTEPEAVRSDADKERLNRKLTRIAGAIADHCHPEVTVTYFIPDARKAGGRYEDMAGAVKRLDPVERKIVFFDGNLISDGPSIAFGSILSLRGSLFKDMDDGMTTP